ncbi:aminotransferase class IV [Clostridium sp.]|nr:aminotransferase class IV [Clostridium sp.]
MFRNTTGYLAEGATSNIFFIKNNILYTPSIEWDSKNVDY